MSKIEEPIERAKYRTKCRHYAQGYGQCYKNSHGNEYYHFTASCAGHCKRMQKWDKEHGYQDVEFELNEFY